MNKVNSTIEKLILLLFIISTHELIAQSPQKMSYQAVIRNINNELIINQLTGIRINILQGSASGAAVYTETHTATSNDNGLVSIDIGGGLPVSGTFSSINWADGPYFLKIETDPNGGNNYSIIGTSQLLSVPYALYALNSGDLTKWLLNGNKIYYNNGNVGIRTPNPQVDLHVVSDNTAFAPARIRLAGRNNNSTNSSWSDLMSEYDGHIMSSKFSISTRDRGDLVNRFTIDSRGKIGIGTNSPLSNVDIFDDTPGFSSPNVHIRGSGNASPYIRLSQFGELGGTTGARLIYDGTPNAGKEYFSIQASNFPYDGTFVDAIIVPGVNGLGASPGWVGIGIRPRQKFHVNDVMRLEPRATAPQNPSKGDIYMDDITNKLRVYDGSQWRDCW
jgi:hypothetical protein